MQGAFKKGDRDKARVCKKLLEMVRLGHLFEASDIGPDFGPTQEAVGSLFRVQDGCSPLSTGEGIVLRTAFDIWNGAGQTTIPELMQNLPPSIVQAIGELIVAVAIGATSYIDAWESKWAGFDAAANFSADT